MRTIFAQRSILVLLFCLSLPFVSCGSDDDDGDNAGPGDMCGGIAAVPCRKDYFCRYPEGICGAGDQSGICQQIPDVCAEIFAPVCGCDDRTYGNECEAYGASQSVKAQGECILPD